MSMVKVTRQEQNRAAAYHEAGHAVMASAAGADVYECWIDGEGCGEVRYRCERSRWRLSDELAVNVAGACAESLLLDRPDIGTVENFLECFEEVRECGEAAAREDMGDVVGDALEIAVLLQDCTTAEAVEQVREARDRALKVLAEEWGDVQMIAECIGGER